MNRTILRLAIPNIITNITIPLLGMVDLRLMGHMGSAKYVGAIALGGMIFNFLFWGFGFLRMGTSGFTAQAYGRRDMGEAAHVLARALITALAGGMLLIVLQWPVAKGAFAVVHSSRELESLAQSYFNIRIWAAPATLCIYAFTGWFIGMQNARLPMILAISVNVLNIMFSLLFIRIFNLRSDGIAWANVASQYVGLALGLFFVSLYVPRLRKYFNVQQVLNRKAFRNFLSVNKDIFIRTLCLIFTLSFFTTQSANTSDTVLAVNTLLFQFFYFFSYFVDGFAYAAEALTGRYIGSGNRKMLVSVVKRLFVWGLGIAVVFTLVYLAGGHFMLKLLTNNSETLNAAKPYLFWVVLVPVITFAAFIWDGIYVGATASKAMRNSMVIITTIIFLPAYYLLNPLMGNHGLWLAMMLFMGARGVFLGIMAKKSVFQLV
ncbi:MAG TPA: MATE family efflux transporter [Bacteroidales bacterium]|nr:MATE family efflux transporter [Bacteroidales bacterium]